MEKEPFIGNNLPKKEIWLQILAKWHELMDRYIKRYNIDEPNEREKDLPYWWNEYANTGFLSGAIWSLDGVVIEQLGVQRDSGDNKSKGWCDFWFGIDIGIDRLRCFVETKKVELGPSTDAIKEIKKKLNESKEQLNRIQNRSDIGVALCFITPYASSKSDALENSESVFGEIIEYFSLVNKDNNIIKIYFPSDYCRIEDDEGYYNPGVAIVGELIKEGG